MITSIRNSNVKKILELVRKPRERRKEGLFVIEGLRMFQETPPDRIRKICVTGAFLKDHKQLVEEKCREGKIGGEDFFVFSEEVFQHVSDTRTPQGVLCLVTMKEEPMVYQPGSLLLMLENIQDPGNLGTMFRTAEGAGVTGIIMDRTTADVYSPKVIRSTMGSIYRVPFLISEDLKDSIREFQGKGGNVYAAYLGGSVCYDEPDYTQSCAFLIGNEGNGLREETAALADQCIQIPMAGKLESLNASVAASILMYEAAQQRRRAGVISQ